LEINTWPYPLWPKPTPPPKTHANPKQIIKEQGVCHSMALPFTLKSILRQKKNYGNSNISPCKNNIIFKKSSKTNQNPSRYYNSTTKSQVSTQAKTSSFKNPYIKIDLLPKGQNPLSYYAL
jgi:hypothetical protein